MTEGDDPLMRGFLYLKAIIARYGVDRGAELVSLGDSLVKQGLFPGRRAAIEAIELQMGLPVTTPISKEAANYTTPPWKTPP